MTTSLVLTAFNQQFVMSQVQRTGMTKTKIINHALDLYRKNLLQKDLVEGFSEQTDEDVAEAMSDFEDYLKILDSELYEFHNNLKYIMLNLSRPKTLI